MLFSRRSPKLAGLAREEGVNCELILCRDRRCSVGWCVGNRRQIISIPPLHRWAKGNVQHRPKSMGRGGLTKRKLTPFLWSMSIPNVFPWAPVIWCDRVLARSFCCLFHKPLSFSFSRGWLLLKAFSEDHTIHNPIVWLIY